MGGTRSRKTNNNVVPASKSAGTSTPKRKKQVSRTDQRDDIFFEHLSNGFTVGESAEAAGYSRRSVYVYFDTDIEFGERWEDAQENAVELLEKAADERGKVGTVNAKSIKTNEGYRIIPYRDYSDSLLALRLKSLAPEKYRENYQDKNESDIENMSIAELMDFLIDNMSVEMKKQMIDRLENGI